MDRIVVPLDGSALAERALPIAQEIARHTGRAVRLLEVVEPDECDRAAAYLDHLAERMTGVDTCRDVAIARPGRCVADSVLGSLHVPGDSLLCMSSHGRSGFGTAVLGSTAEDLLRRTERPVLVVGRECTLPWPGHRRTLLVPVDGSAEDEQILPPVAEIVERSDLQPVLVQVAHPFDVAEGSHAGQALEHTREQLHAMGIDAKAEHRFASNVPLTIDEVARAWGAALIVMALHVPAGAPRTLLGSVTMSTVRHAPCPVLVYPGHALSGATS
jgi:nucleotide-binding universal stress UspA family protein